MEPQIKNIASLYMQSCELAHKSTYSIEEHRGQIICSIKKLKLTNEQIAFATGYSKTQFIEDLIEVANDMKIVLKLNQSQKLKFQTRANLHFNNIYPKDMNPNTSKHTRKVVQMYSQNLPLTNVTLPSQAYSRTIYLMGLTKGNGVILSANTILSCAHTFIEEQNNKIMRVRCFSTGNTSYGISLLLENGLFQKTDLSIAKIIDFKGQEIKDQLKMKKLKFGNQFQPISCLQVGLLYVPNQCLYTFETAEGFIEQNFYPSEESIELKNEMGLLVHSCYGMWGTSGSPLWSSQGQLIGIHNAWDQNAHDVAMIVHDSDSESEDEQEIKKSEKCRVIRQYQRRAVGAHAINKIIEQWNTNTKEKVQQNGQEIQKQKYPIKTKAISKQKKSLKIK